MLPREETTVTSKNALLSRSLFFAATAFAALTVATGPAGADMSGGVLKVGLMTDFSSVYADSAGEASLLAYQMAIDDFGGKMGDKPIELVKADFQNKADLALTIARKWIDEDGVDVILDAPNSGIAIALGKYIVEKNKVYLTGAVSSDITGKFCLPNTVQFQADTYAQAAVAAEAIVKKGLKTWFSITADYAMGHAMEADTAKIVKANGGEMIGSVRHPFGAADMSSFVLQAQASKAQVLSIVDKMKATPVNDLYAKNGHIREDGRLIKEMYLAQIKMPGEVKKDWDLYNIVATVPGERSFRPVAESECPLLKK
jgi:branched-chain amino acid transport system substrate-binding protein